MVSLQFIILHTELKVKGLLGSASYIEVQLSVVTLGQFCISILYFFMVFHFNSKHVMGSVFYLLVDITVHINASRHT